MFVEEHRDQRTAEDDFEWVNAWAAASAREGKPPHVAAAPENAARTPAPAVTVIEAPPLVEPVPTVDAAAPAQEPVDDSARAQGPVADTARAQDLAAVTAPAGVPVPQVPSSDDEELAAEPTIEPEAEATQETPAAGPVVEDEASIPQSEEGTSIPQSIECMPLAETPVQFDPQRRTPWTSLFRLIAGHTGRSPRDLAAEHQVATHETVPLHAPTPVPVPVEHPTTPVVIAAEPIAVPAEHATTPIAVAAEPIEPQPAALAPLAPDQLERDIAEIEFVRDQLLAEAPAVATTVVPEASFLRRTSDLVPILVGGALGFILLVVFGAAASFVSLR